MHVTPTDRLRRPLCWLPAAASAPEIRSRRRVYQFLSKRDHHRFKLGARA
jgi:hypothetical protein